MSNIIEYLNSVPDVLKSALDSKAYKKILLFNIVQSVASAIYFIIFGIITILLIILLFANIKVAPSSPAEWSSFFSNNLLGIVLLTIFILIGIIVFSLISLYFYSASMKLCKSINEKKLIGIKEALIEGKEGYVSLIKTEILWTIIILAITSVILIPIFLIIIILLPSLSVLFTNPATIVVFFFIMFVLIIGLVLVSILISPFTTLILPVAIFEDRGAVYSLKESFRRAKSNYLAIIIYIIIVWLIISAISIINYFINWPINIVGQIIIMLGSIAGPIGIIIAYSIYFGISIVVGLIFSSVIMLFSNTLIINLYQITAEKKKKF